ncbi:hypothetical protein [Loigolactobacillus bifermentans]|uniref:Ornithine cyclodeaminase n=1 Tax=Loigolactobacillus bifermentans DSM 20003 TaxID=1423726 RepID=A0A0R1H050_9LACO|nr:hypothetical protein [Loigolactobacillus bifermentans]KRK39856.1 ornithine cyclodeaminase [Loigolactobacillus bifermentans DSM 20003]QGG61511.1 ornithine cyclodeaminase family protein [Loigolactobacillus bifermentans]
MLILNQATLQQALTMSQAIAACREAFQSMVQGQTKVPLRTNLAIDDQRQLLVMPAYAAQPEALGIKVLSVYPENRQRGLPTIPATMVSLDATTGQVNALLDGTYLTQLRTGALQGVATAALARPDAQIGALIGTGGQAAMQLAAMLAVRPLTEVRIYSPHFEHVQAFIEQQQPLTQAKLVATKTAKACVTNADVITTVTTATQPTFEAAWVKPGAHVNGVGAYTPDMCELPTALFKQAAHIFYDTKSGVLAEAGDVQTALQANAFQPAAAQEIGTLLLDASQGRQTDQEITVFKSVGTAALDVTVAQAALEQAKKQGLGQQIDF